jgi:hypothetical protein
LSVRHACLLVLCVVVLGCGYGSGADTIFGRGGEVQWIDVPDGRLKTEVYSTTPLSARPVLVIVLHGDLFNPTPSYQYAFAQAFRLRAVEGIDSSVPA